MNYKNLPKIELHLHLDCSLSFQVVKKLSPGTTENEYRQSFIGPAKCHDLLEYIKRANSALELMQNEEALRLVTMDLFDQLQKDRVIYAEIRFAPILHANEGLHPQEVVQIVNDAVTEGISKTGVESSLILCTLRHFNKNQSLQTVGLVNKFKGTNVRGFDIAADEVGFPIDAHTEAFEFAHQNNIHCTCHAGEAGGAKSVWETLNNFRPSRIGHGVRSIEDEKLVEYLATHNIHLEVCPTSNVQTNAIDVMNNHPADKFYNNGVSISINTDCRTISDTTLVKEYSILEDYFKWTKQHFLNCNLEAIRHSFAPRDIKERIKEELIQAYR
jgi:adenosine deaminase